jgi:hypothetical protein
MATAADGAITLSYRPLTTMDELHILLLAAVSVRTVTVSVLEQVFSLPSSVVSKELTVLESYGLTRKARDQWSATDRGQQVASVWNLFQSQVEICLPTSGTQWLLGPGEFVIDEMIRDKEEIDALARGYGIADSASSLKFLDERRDAYEKFESFIREWPLRAIANTDYSSFGEAIFFDTARLAESDDELKRLEELLASHIGEVIKRVKEQTGADVHGDGQKTNDDGEGSIRKRGQDVMKKFDDVRRTQRRQNHHLAKIKRNSETLLAGQWLAAQERLLVDAFSREPAAFIFKSTVPLVRTEVPKEKEKEKETTSTRPPSPPQRPKPKQEEEGALRSLFRWIFG